MLFLVFLAAAARACLPITRAGRRRLCCLASPALALSYSFCLEEVLLCASCAPSRSVCLPSGRTVVGFLFVALPDAVWFARICRRQGCPGWLVVPGSVCRRCRCRCGWPAPVPWPGRRRRQALILCSWASALRPALFLPNPGPAWAAVFSSAWFSQPGSGSQLAGWLSVPNTALTFAFCFLGWAPVSALAARCACKGLEIAVCRVAWPASGAAAGGRWFVLVVGDGFQDPAGAFVRFAGFPAGCASSSVGGGSGRPSLSPGRKNRLFSFPVT